MARGTQQNETCPICRLRYADFRTGHTYQDVYDSFWSTSEDSRDWVHKRRHSILGRWHEWKMELWEKHLEDCFENE